MRFDVEYPKPEEGVDGGKLELECPPTSCPPTSCPPGDVMTLLYVEYPTEYPPSGGGNSGGGINGGYG